MRYKSPELMEKRLTFSEMFFLKNKRLFSTDVIADKLGIACGTAYKYPVHINDKRMLAYGGKDISTVITRNADIIEYGRTDA